MYTPARGPHRGRDVVSGPAAVVGSYSFVVAAPHAYQPSLDNSSQSRRSTVPIPTTVS